jgi:hypothetical protein
MIFEGDIARVTNWEMQLLIFALDLDCHAMELLLLILYRRGAGKGCSAAGHGGVWRDVIELSARIQPILTQQTSLKSWRPDFPVCLDEQRVAAGNTVT